MVKRAVAIRIQLFSDGIISEVDRNVTSPAIIEMKRNITGEISL